MSISRIVAGPLIAAQFAGAVAGYMDTKTAHERVASRGGNISEEIRNIGMARSPLEQLLVSTGIGGYFLGVGIASQNLSPNTPSQG